MERRRSINYKHPIWSCPADDLLAMSTTALAERFGVSQGYVSYVRIKKTGIKYKKNKEACQYEYETIGDNDYHGYGRYSNMMVKLEKMIINVRKEGERKGLEEGRIWYRGQSLDALKPSVREFIESQNQ